MTFKAFGDTSGTRKIGMEEVTPPFGDPNWEHVGTYKIENTNGEWYWIAPIEHWVRSVPPEEGFYLNSVYPGELIRIIGFYPEFGAYLFKEKSE